ncbi:EpsG family protein [Massilia sp. R2A-15]|uniref:EpsG family protein n=1 Tax=Massilia sp. R2A-15 TaxID=3064278 RepID=UPI00273482BA|nr:EpsG family protein [Massilia sp. R2A-15]WLI88046.1 EpsG family protein [Massilia sp. R2A-15]
MHYLLANSLLMLLLPVRRVSVSAVLMLAVLMGAFTIVYMNGSPDYKGYLTYFLCSQNQFCLKDGTLNFETSYVIISNIFFALFYKVGGPWVVAFYSSLALFMKLFILRSHASHFGVALMVYATYAWYVQEMTQIRIGLAIAFYWLAVLHGSRREMWRSAIFFMAAVFFHKSTLVGAVYFVFPFIQASSAKIFKFCVAGSAVGLLVSGTPQFLKFMFAIGGVDPRISVYSEAVGNIVSSTNYLTVYFAASLVMLAIYALVVPDEEATQFEIYSFRLACIGLLYYAFLYWVPTVGLRGFEFFLCLMPFIAAAAFRTTQSYVIKAVLIGLAVLIFYNLVIRNGTRLDFVLPGQAQEQWME